MKGKYHIIVQNNRLRYEFDIKRNITIIRGDSATGKTTLINMLSSAAALGESSGIDVICERPCRVLSGSDWQYILPNLHEQIIFLDEENHFIKTREFASAIKESDNYYVIITREDLPGLPYAVEEIYGIHTSGKYHDLKRTYNETYQIYSPEEFTLNVQPDTVIVEDSHSGYDFFKSICSDTGIICKSAQGKSNLKDTIRSTANTNTLIIADGAAIGSEMNELYQFMKHSPGLKCYLPESFEWIILKSGLIDGRTVQEILLHPEDYIESKTYFSWERYFTSILTQYTQGTYLSYTKKTLNKSFLHEKSKEAILNVMEGISFHKE
ncbi:MAG: translation initiation factor 2 [Eubacteriales bacterium]|nr:translation initiation factor 2 [Eubacteriales bacterium]